MRYTFTAEQRTIRTYDVEASSPEEAYLSARTLVENVNAGQAVEGETDLEQRPFEVATVPVPSEEPEVCVKCGSRNIAQLDDESWECHDCGEDWDFDAEHELCERCNARGDLDADTGLCSTCELGNNGRVSL